MRTGRLFFLILLIALISACSLLFLFSKPILELLASGLVVEDKLQNSDAVVVLGGTAPSRVMEAIDLYNSGYVSSIIITRGGLPEGADYLRSKNIIYPEEADLNKMIANKLGIGAKNLILLPGRVYSTKEEAEFIKEYAIKKGYKSIIVTTSKSHSKRAEIIFSRVFKYTGIKLIIRPTKYDSFDPRNLNINKNHWKNVVLEYQKLFYYYADELM